MPISLPNLKRCLTDRASALAITALIAAASPYTFASIPSAFHAGAPSIQEFKSDIRNQLRSNTKSFDPLISKWQMTYGISAMRPLLGIASDKKANDQNRYIALMGAAKIGGSRTASLFLPYLKDPSWMIRSGAIRVMTTLDNPKTSAAVLPLLKDRALVVRLEAVESVKTLRPVGTERALLQTLEDPQNYHAGRALWVPAKASEALAAITGRTVNLKAPLAQQIKEWKRTLTQR